MYWQRPVFDLHCLFFGHSFLGQNAAFWGAAWASLTGVHHALIAPRLRGPLHCCVGSAVNGTVFQHGRRVAAHALFPPPSMRSSLPPSIFPPRWRGLSTFSWNFLRQKPAQPFCLTSLSICAQSFASVEKICMAICLLFLLRPETHDTAYFGSPFSTPLADFDAVFCYCDHLYTLIVLEFIGYVR